MFTVAGFRRDLWHVTTFPAVLNTLSEGVLEDAQVLFCQMTDVREIHLVYRPPLRGLLSPSASGP